MTNDGIQMLFGADSSEGLVGAAERKGGMSLWWRRPGSSETTVEDIDYKPWLLCSHRELLDAVKPEPQISALKGENLYRWMVACEDWAQQSEIEKLLSKAYRSNKDAFEAEPGWSGADAVTEYLLSSGRTFFKGFAQDDLHVLYIALRAYNTDGAEYADASVPSDRIIMLGLSDGKGWQQILTLGEDGLSDEAALIGKLRDVIAERNPDILCGHDLYKGSLGYICARIKNLKLKAPQLLNWGRDGSVMKVRASRAPAAEKQLEYPRADVAGRHLVDTWFLTQYYDIVKRDLERYDAPYVANYLEPALGLPEPLAPWDYDQLFDGERDKLKADVINELNAAAEITRMLLPSYFAQSQMLPLSLQDCVVRGNAVKINHLLMREYLRRGESIPEPAETWTTTGGYTELRRTGIIPNVLNADIASLYPSIMLKDGVKPRQDTGDVYVPMLRELTHRRLEAKKEARSHPDKNVRVMADARQAAFKIFINSFFGYLGTSRMNWADAEQAGYITRNGQLLVNQLAEAVSQEGGSIIEIDTDGVYFTAEGIESQEAGEALVAKVSTHLPDGINVELGGFYPSMLSHKVKNYALLCSDGEIIVKGSGMKSRGLEPFLHAFMQHGIACVLRGEPEKIEARYEELKSAISERRIDIRQLAKTDTLIESLPQYRAKTGGGGRNKAAAYEVALAAKRELRAGDQVSYYITGDKATVKAFEAAKPIRQYDPANPDYNIKFYVKKLADTYRKVQSFLQPEADQDGLFESGTEPDSSGQ